MVLAIAGNQDAKGSGSGLLRWLLKEIEFGVSSHNSERTKEPLKIGAGAGNEVIIG